MKKLFISTLVLLAIPFQSFAATFEAKPLADLMATIDNAKFKYQETGLVFGFDSIQSCLYVSDSILVLKNYCYPKKAYPAKGYTIISAKFGMIDLYEEERRDIVQRDVMITNFPETVAPYLPTTLNSMSIQKLSGIKEDLYLRYQPACWSTNWSYYTGLPEAKCTVNSSAIDGFDTWATETQSLTLDKTEWSKLIEKLDKRF